MECLASVFCTPRFLDAILSRPLPSPSPALSLRVARSREELLSTRSITTIGQQTHHVQVHEAPEGAQQPLQVGTMTLVVTDITLPGGHGVLHVVDCVMCCLRLLHHCRYEQVRVCPE